MKECSMCIHAERDQGRLICKLFRCSTPFARHDEEQCGEAGKRFERAG